MTETSTCQNTQNYLSLLIIMFMYVKVHEKKQILSSTYDTVLRTIQIEVSMREEKK